MELSRIAPGDIVHCNVNGRVFTAQAVARENGMLTIAPPAGVTAYRVSARDVTGHEPTRQAPIVHPTAGERLAAAIARAGGLATVPDLARRLRINVSRMHGLAAEPTFPAPVAHVGGGRTALYAVADVEAWAQAR